MYSFMKTHLFFTSLAAFVAVSMPLSAFSRQANLPARQMEYMDRGVVAINQGDQVYISWRLLATDPDNVKFDVYRRDGQNEPIKLNRKRIKDTTDFIDDDPDRIKKDTRYFVVPLYSGTNGAPGWALAPQEPSPYLSITLDPPDSSYSPNDCSVADLDGDGQYEIVLKWDPSNAKDNSQKGVTDNVYLDAYKLDSTQLWRIDLGPNIRAGAHYTQFMVYDLDGDGKAEVVCKTGDGTKDGKGKTIGERRKEWRNDGGYILSGPEYLTCFDGLTGKEIDTVDYVPYRIPYGDEQTPSSDTLKRIWGDGYGNRQDRFLAGVAYLDGVHPSVVMCRGYYTRTFLVAWDLKKGKLKQRWIFDSDTVKEEGEYAGQGNHNLVVADVDGDGKDEITFGAMCVDDDGSGLYTTEMGHGDAGHLTDLDPDRPGLEYWTCQEHAPYGAALRDAETGEIIMRHNADNDTGRCCAADIDPRSPGYEMWSTGNRTVYSAKGEALEIPRPGPVNFVIQWDDNDLMELLDRTTISKYNWETGKTEPLLEASQYNCDSNNGTKATPCLSGDILGDYREEVIFRTRDAQELRIFTTTIPAKRRLITLMQDPQYRMAIAWQNVAYNQPPHPSFFMGDGMEAPPKPNIKIITPE